MQARPPFLIILLIISFHSISFSQFTERVEFKAKDSTTIYYLATSPRSKTIRGTVVLFSSFTNLNWLTSQTKLHNVSYDNDILFVYTTLNNKFYADSEALERINILLTQIVSKFSVDTTKFVLAGLGLASNIILRYTELSQQFPTNYLIKPKAIFFADCHADLFAFWKRLQRQLQTNFDQGGVEIAKYAMDVMTKNIGEITSQRAKYNLLSPFNIEVNETGHEQYLKNTPIRLYYDVDAEWQLKKRNSFFDTNIPEGSELIRRLLYLGNNEAEFISSKQKAIGSNGVKDPTSLSIIDEVDCLHWIKQKLDIFDYNTYKPKYAMDIPRSWSLRDIAFQLHGHPI